MNEETVETPAEEVAEAVVAEEAAVEETAPKPRRSRKQAEETVEPEATEVVVEEAPAPAPAPAVKIDAPAYPALAITSGGQHDSIKAAQKKLGVAETGVVDADTKAAVKAVQKKAGLKADGTISANTWAAIFA